MDNLVKRRKLGAVMKQVTKQGIAPDIGLLYIT